MKKVLLVLGMVALTLGMNAQKVNELSLEDVPAKYVEVVLTKRVYLDYGQIGEINDLTKLAGIFSEDGTRMSFNGSMGVLNLMGSKGYKYVSHRLVTIGSQRIWKYLLENTNYKNKTNSL